MNKTERGFAYFCFEDAYEQKCSLQKSSLATKDCIWLGVENTGPNITDNNGNYNANVNTRMHLDISTVKFYRFYRNL